MGISCAIVLAPIAAAVTDMMVSVLVSASAECILKCAEEYLDPDDPQYDEYFACIEECKPGSGFVGGADNPDVPDEPPIYASVADSPLDDIRLALLWAQDIRRMRTDGPDPVELMSSLRAFFETPWEDELLRDLLVGPYFVACARETLLSDELTPELASALHDMVLAVALGEHLDAASEPVRDAILLLAMQLATPEEREEVERAASAARVVIDGDQCTLGAPEGARLAPTQTDGFQGASD